MVTHSLTLHEPPDALRERAAAELARRSLAFFVRCAWHVVEPGCELVWGWHLDLICKRLEAVTRRECLRLVINIPPGHMKSLLVAVFWPAWEWLTRPEERTLFLANSADLAARDSRRCREVITSEWYQRVLALTSAERGQESWSLADDQNEKINYENTRRGFRECLSIGAKVTGKRSDKQVLDDPYDAKELQIGSPEQIARRLLEVEAIYDGVLASRLNDLATGARVLIMQRLHQDDLAAHCIAAGYDVVCLPTEYDPHHPQVCADDPRTEPGELLFPAKFPAHVIAQIKQNPLSNYEGQHGQQPRPPGGGLFRADHFPRFEVAPIQSPGTWYQSWDFRHGGKGKETSFAVGSLYFRPAAAPATVYLVDVVRGRWDPDESLRQFDLKQADPLWSRAKAILVEDKADGVAVLSMRRRQVAGLIPIKPLADKESRARAVQPLTQAGCVLLPRVAPWLAEWEREVFAFPATSQDDQVDTLTQLLDYLHGVLTPNYSSLPTLAASKGHTPSRL